MATILTVTANPLLDHVAAVALLPGAATRIDGFRVVAGGKGINVGRVLVRHGHRVIATGFAGGAAGEQLGTLISADGMEPDLVRTAARSRIGFLVSDGVQPPTQVMEHGSKVTAEELGLLVELVRRRVRESDLVVVGGSVPDPACDLLFRLLLGVCHQAQVACWVDAYGPAMDLALAGPHPPGLVKPNREEYGSTRARRWLPARELHLTDGSRVIRVRHPDGRFRVTPPVVAASNAVGSGDCYIAGLAHARLSGWSLVEQLRYAAAAGAANARAGAIARIEPTDIDALRDQVVVRPAGD